jgi:hypothetical protein
MPQVKIPEKVYSVAKSPDLHNLHLNTIEYD